MAGLLICDVSPWICLTNTHPQHRIRAFRNASRSGIAADGSSARCTDTPKTGNSSLEPWNNRFRPKPQKRTAQTMRLDKETTDTFVAWWRDLYPTNPDLETGGQRAIRARLRRCGSVWNIMMEPAFAALVHRFPTAPPPRGIACAGPHHGRARACPSRNFHP